MGEGQIFLFKNINIATKNEKTGAACLDFSGGKPLINAAENIMVKIE